MNKSQKRKMKPKSISDIQLTKKQEEKPLTIGPDWESVFYSPKDHKMMDEEATEKYGKVPRLPKSKGPSAHFVRGGKCSPR